MSFCDSKYMTSKCDLSFVSEIKSVETVLSINVCDQKKKKVGINSDQHSFPCSTWGIQSYRIFFTAGLWSSSSQGLK